MQASASALETAGTASGASRRISASPASARNTNMPAFHRQPSATSSAARSDPGFSTNSVTRRASPPAGSPGRT